MLGHNRVTLTGVVSTSPFIRTQPERYTVATFKLTVTDEETPDRSDTLRIVCWSALAGFVEKNVKPGMLITVDGTLRTREIPSAQREIWEVVAKRVQVERDETHTAVPARRESARRAGSAARAPQAVPPVRGNAA